MNEVRGFNRVLFFLFWGLVIAAIAVGVDLRQLTGVLLLFSSTLAAALVFFISAWMGIQYANNFWLLHATVANAALYYALHHLPLNETWPLPLMAAVSALLWMNVQPLYRAAWGEELTTSPGASSQYDSTLQYRAERPRYVFADVVGMDDLKIRLGEAVAAIKANFRAKTQPKKWYAFWEKREDAPVDDDIGNGILLFGDPGNGKTYFAEALAGELKLPIITATFGDVVSRWVGETTERVMAVFDDAERQAPCVLFLDEIDSLLIRREYAINADSESPRTVNAILTRLVQVRAKGVVVMAATNFIDRLDIAAIREGRFDFKIEVPPPDFKARVALMSAELSAHSGGVPFEEEAVQRAARRYEGFSAARVASIAAEAAILVTKGQVESKIVTFPVLQQALRNLQGTLGVRISEVDPKLEDLVMSPPMAKKINGIAKRMIEIEEMEQLGGSVPKGVLFYGPPGSGKTATVKALAKTTGWALLAVTGQELQLNPERIDEIVAQSSALRPCIIFIDEADDVLADRRGTTASLTLTNKLLTAIDGANSRVPDVVWIAATNNPGAMDSAALRGGRFTEKVEFSFPDATTLETFILTWISRRNTQLASGLTPKEIADMMGNVSFANAEAILQTAVNHMIERRQAHESVEVNRDDIANGCKTVLEV